MRHALGLGLTLLLLAGQALGAPPHSADTDADGKFSIDELTRLIQFYVSREFHCDGSGEDGYAIGAGDRSCPPHASDYDPQDWRISLQELLRAIQYYNSPGVFACTDGDDGFCPRRETERPNVLLLVLDTLKAEQVDKVRDGKKVMPYLSELAAGSTRFTRAWSAGSWTCPGMAGIFSGMYVDRFPEQSAPDGTGGQSTHFPMPAEVETIAEWLGKYGYDNWGVQTNQNVRDIWGYAQGFPTGQYNYLSQIAAYNVTEATLSAANSCEEPFFLLAQYFDPHSPYMPPSDIDYPFNDEPPLTGQDAVYLSPEFYGKYARDQFEAFFGVHAAAYAPLTPAGAAVMQHRYDRECYYMDQEVGRAVDAVLGKYPNTIVVVVSDHGESLYDRDIMGHGHTSYEELMHVPFFISGPGIPARQIDERVSTMNLMPTLARILELPLEAQWQGHDLIHSGREEPIFGYSLGTVGGFAIETQCVVEGDLKYIADSKFGVPQLFDLAADPTERNNLAGARPEDAARLGGMLEAHHAENSE